MAKQPASYYVTHVKEERQKFRQYEASCNNELAVPLRELSEAQKKLSYLEGEFKQKKTKCGNMVLYGDRVVCGLSVLYFPQQITPSIQVSGNVYSTTQVTGKTGGFGVGRAIVGGAIAGPLGAVAGGVTKKGKITSTSQVHDTREIVFSLAGETGFLTDTLPLSKQPLVQMFIAQVQSAAANYTSRKELNERGQKQTRELIAQLEATIAQKRPEVEARIATARNALQAFESSGSPAEVEELRRSVKADDRKTVLKYALVVVAFLLLWLLGSMLGSSGTTKTITTPTTNTPAVATSTAQPLPGTATTP